MINKTNTFWAQNFKNSTKTLYKGCFLRSGQQVRAQLLGQFESFLLTPFFNFLVMT